jgi:hypothetical protein
MLERGSMSCDFAFSPESSIVFTLVTSWTNALIGLCCHKWVADATSLNVCDAHWLSACYDSKSMLFPTATRPTG